MNLSEEQKLALVQGQPVSVLIDETECVLVRSDVYLDRTSSAKDADGPLSSDQRLFLLREAGQRAGWEDPEMAVYDDLDPRRT